MSKLSIKDLAIAMGISKVAADQAFSNPYYPALLALQGKGHQQVAHAIIRQQAWERDQAVAHGIQQQQQQQQCRRAHEVAVVSVVADACDCMQPGPVRLANIVPQVDFLPADDYEGALLELYRQGLYVVAGCPWRNSDLRERLLAYRALFVRARPWQPDDDDSSDSGGSEDLCDIRFIDDGDLHIQRVLAWADPSSVPFPTLIRQPRGVRNAVLHLIDYYEASLVFDAAADLLDISDLDLAKMFAKAAPEKVWDWLLEQRNEEGIGAAAGAAAAAAAAAVHEDVIDAVLRDPVSYVWLWPSLADTSPVAMADWVSQHVPLLVQMLLHEDGVDRMIMCQALVAVLDARAARPLLQALWADLWEQPHPVALAMLDRQRMVMCSFAEQYGELRVELAAESSGGVPSWFGVLGRPGLPWLHTYTWPRE